MVGAYTTVRSKAVYTKHLRLRRPSREAGS